MRRRWVTVVILTVLACILVIGYRQLNAYLKWESARVYYNEVKLAIYPDLALEDNASVLCAYREHNAWMGDGCSFYILELGEGIEAELLDAISMNRRWRACPMDEEMFDETIMSFYEGVLARSVAYSERCGCIDAERIASFNEAGGGYWFYLDRREDPDKALSEYMNYTVCLVSERYKRLLFLALDS